MKRFVSSTTIMDVASEFRDYTCILLENKGGIYYYTANSLQIPSKIYVPCYTRNVDAFVHRIFSPPGSEVWPVSSASAFLFLSVLAWMHAMRDIVRAESVHSFFLFTLWSSPYALVFFRLSSFDGGDGSSPAAARRAF